MCCVYGKCCRCVAGAVSKQLHRCLTDDSTLLPPLCVWHIRSCCAQRARGNWCRALGLCHARGPLPPSFRESSCCIEYHGMRTHPTRSVCISAGCPGSVFSIATGVSCVRRHVCVCVWFVCVHARSCVSPPVCVQPCVSPAAHAACGCHSSTACPCARPGGPQQRPCISCTAATY